MSRAMDVPLRVSINAWIDGSQAAMAEVSGDARAWALRSHVDEVHRMLQPEPLASLGDWHDERVGWGLVVADNESIDKSDRARAADTPEPIRTLLAARPGAPVLRYRDDIRFTHLRRYYPDRQEHDIALSGSPRGTGPGCLPRYLLIYGSPVEIPWEFQYLLSGPCMVGRISLTGDALERYVERLVNGWDDSKARPEAPVVWGVDWGGDDITGLLRRTIAAPIAEMFRADHDIDGKMRYIDGSKDDATCESLIDALATNSPALVVTTSHGRMGPLEDPSVLAENLGRPVDGSRVTLDPTELLGAWEPDGAIWYAHACCSAGSADLSSFRMILEEESSVTNLLRAMEALGSRVATLPMALLEAEKPLRAFVGHVEPTFNWTISDPETSQRLTNSITRAFYNRLFQPEPLGLAMRDWYLHVGELLAQWDRAVEAFNRGEETWGVAMARQLAARDRQSMVILGDPVVTLPPLS